MFERDRRKGRTENVRVKYETSKRWCYEFGPVLIKVTNFQRVGEEGTSKTCAKRR